MNPDIENFLEAAFDSIQPTSSEIGRVVVEPDYDADPAQQDVGALQSELLACVREQSPDPGPLRSVDGFAVKIPPTYPVLAKYVRRLTLHQNKLDGSWVEVAPPGSWI